MVGKSSLTLSRPRMRRRSLPMERVFSGRISAGASLTCPLFLDFQRQRDDPLLGKAQGVVVTVVVLDRLRVALLGQHLLAQRLHAVEDLLHEVWADLHAVLPQGLGVLG